MKNLKTGTTIRIMKMRTAIIILIVLASTQVVGQYKQNKENNVFGIIGMSALPTSFIVSEINYTNFVGKFGKRDAYMKGSKLNSYENMMRQNSNIILTGTIVTGVGLLIQHHISKKRNKSTRPSCWR